MRRVTTGPGYRYISTIAFIASLHLLAPPTHAQFQNLHDFAGGTTDGAAPLGGFTVSGSTLYGMTTAGGSANDGVLFSFPTAGGSPTLIHTFVGGNSDGSTPQASLLLSGSTFYGTTMAGGNSTGNFYGTVFSINIAGGPIQILHSFQDLSDGEAPVSNMLLSGSTFYGLSSGNNGYFYSMNSDGTGFNSLHNFAGAPTEPNEPHGSLIQSGSNFYGMSDLGGANDTGEIFSINTTGTVTLLHSFAAATDGSFPEGSLLQIGTKLYGLAHSGGAHSSGTLFSINTDGTGFTVLRAFGATAADRGLSNGSLIVSGTTLYGVNTFGGANNDGDVFSYNTVGGAYNILHTFNGTDGAAPSNTLAISGATLYGMTQLGGANSDGVIYSIAIPEPTSLAAASLCSALILARRRRAGAR